MKKRIFIFSLFGFACILIVFFVSTPRKDSSFLPLLAFQTKTIRIGKTTFTVFIADTPQKRSQGLMNVRELPAGRGMLFVFDQPQKFSFYNKNTLIPLDLLWIKNGVVEEISYLPPIKGDNPAFAYPSKPVDNVIELNAESIKRYGIEVGDEVRT